MKDNRIVYKFVSLLSRFSEEELLELRTLFQNPRANEAFLKVLDGSLELTRLQSTKGSFDHDVEPKIEKERNNAKKLETSKSSSTEGSPPINGFNQRFADILENKNFYPSTKDVVDAVNDGFNWEIKYEDFHKRDRKDLIKQILNRLGDIEAGQRRKMVSSFLSNIRARKDWEDLDRHYRDLFSVLDRDE